VLPKRNHALIFFFFLSFSEQLVGKSTSQNLLHEEQMSAALNSFCTPLKRESRAAWKYSFFSLFSELQVAAMQYGAKWVWFYSFSFRLAGAVNIFGTAWVDRSTSVSHEFFLHFSSISEGFCVIFPLITWNAKNTKTRQNVKLQWG